MIGAACSYFRCNGRIVYADAPPSLFAFQAHLVHLSLLIADAATATDERRKTAKAAMEAAMDAFTAKWGPHA
jgi:hypothetical protein